MGRGMGPTACRVGKGEEWTLCGVIYRPDIHNNVKNSRLRSDGGDRDKGRQNDDRSSSTGAILKGPVKARYGHKKALPGLNPFSRCKVCCW